MTSSRAFLSVLLMATVFLTSCASYRASVLPNLNTDCIVSTRSVENVTLCAKAFDKKDCKKFLDRNVIRYGYIPVQLLVENNSDNDYLFSLNRVSLPIASYEEVAEKCHTSTVGRVAGYTTAALLTCGLFFIPAIVDGIKSTEANRALDLDFALKCAKDHVIYRHSHSNMLLFVPAAAYQPAFSVTLLDQCTQQQQTFRVFATQ